MQGGRGGVVRDPPPTSASLAAVSSSQALPTRTGIAAPVRGLVVAAIVVALALTAPRALAAAPTVTATPPPGTTTPATTPAVPPAHLPATRLLTPATGSVANGTSPLSIELSAPVAPESPSPEISPSVAGSWRVEGDYEVFTPVSTLEPCSSYTITVWGRTASVGHAQLGQRRTLHVSVGCPPLSALQQGLARLGYLAARFRPTYVFHEPPAHETRRQAALDAFDPPRGRLAPEPSDAPPVQMGRLDETTRGAIEIYQADRHLSVTGAPDRETWESLLYDLTVDRRDPQAYTWVSVSESLPETLQVHEGDRVVLSTLANTGVSGAETEQGIFPIYARYVSTSMSGEDPDGTKYDVPDVPWVNYFNGGDAVHGYPRASYGSPQSNGCVELPIETARRVFGMLALGDIVWVR
jgi:hypothetical protein